MVGSKVEKTSRSPASCTECQRRKQKADVKAEEPELKATDLPALAAKDELRGLGYLADDQNLLFGNAAPTANVSAAFSSAHY
ncbi:hypothetical protein PENSUB_12413 [Penicillium subrubescens]|uniref:Uncharacterized protein n=1 Tax=Penicillium subrubescens TaxID=1316194 RepID=A0A1Q5SZJ5_9EURO|nr:hypothetical protein PENSUB_12413 [Penicillium subrubescens]